MTNEALIVENTNNIQFDAQIMFLLNVTMCEIEAKRSEV